MLFHPGHHESLLALREAELSRRARFRPLPRAAAGWPGGQRAASVLRLVADRLDPQSRGAFPDAARPAAMLRGSSAEGPASREDIARLASLLAALDERRALFLQRRIG